MIKIKTNNIHSNEKKYILETIFSDILGIATTFENCDEHTYEITFPNGKQIIIPDIFLSSQINQKHWKKYEIPKINFETNINIKKNEHSLFGLYGDSNITISNEKIFVNNDIIGTSFVFLSRLEELNKNHDHFGRYQYKNSIAHQFKIIHRPIINEYIDFFKDAILYLDSSITFKEHKFDLMLTHDIDKIRKWTLKHLLKHTIINFGKKSYLKGFKRFIISRFNKKLDSYYNFDHIMNLSNKYNINSFFMFMALEKNEYEFLYSLDDVEDVIHKILRSKNHKVGIHPSKITFNNFENSNREINRLSVITNQNLEYSRQHYLMFDVENTWNILNKNGIKYDLTLGYPEMIGFRCGICYPFRVFDINTKQKLDLIEIPLIMMDVTMTEYMKNYNSNELRSMINNTINQVKKFNGTLNIIWHNNSYYDYIDSSFENLLLTIIETSLKK